MNDLDKVDEVVKECLELIDDAISIEVPANLLKTLRDKLHGLRGLKVPGGLEDMMENLESELERGITINDTLPDPSRIKHFTGLGSGFPYNGFGDIDEPVEEEDDWEPSGKVAEVDAMLLRTGKVREL